MSVVKSKRTESELEVVTKAIALSSYTIHICSNEKNFPKRYRWCLTSKIVEHTIDICNYVNMANSVYVSNKEDFQTRRQYQNKALASSYALITMMDIAYATFGIDDKRIEGDWVGYHTSKIIDSFCQGENPDIGMGLGSQITQLTQLAVLDKMDHFIKERLGIKQYIRYMDDFILIHEDKEYLKYCLEEINKHIISLKLTLNIKKTQIFPLKQGIKFLGFSFHLTDTGKVIKKLTKENISHEKRKLRKLKKLVDNGVMTRKNVDECYTSWKAHAMQGNTHNLILSMDKYYNNLWR